MRRGFIPLGRPDLSRKEETYLLRALRGGHLMGDGPFTRRCEAHLAQEIGCARALLTTSGTHALEMAALLLGIGPDDEVVVPSFTFVSTASAFALRGARIVFADVRPDTLNLDEARLPERVTRRTRAIVAMHYGGVACEMDEILEIAASRGIAVVEDNAHGLFGAYRGRPLGTLGRLSAQSFHETKNLVSGEGGALFVNDPALAARAEILREKGTDRSRFLRGEVDRYTWVDLGSSYVPSDLLAAVLLAQLERREAIQRARARIWRRYARELAGWAQEIGAALPTVPAHCTPSWHTFHLLLPTAPARDRFIAHLRARGVAAAFHYLPLHLSAMGRRLGGRPGDCPVTEDVAGRLVRLPLFSTLTRDRQSRVIRAVTSFCPPRASAKRAVIPPAWAGDR